MQLKELSNKRSVELFVALGNLSSKEGVKFAVAVSKARRGLKPIVEDYETAIKPSEAFIEYDKARYDLCVEMAEKEENGEPKKNASKNEFVIHDMAAFNQALEALKFAHHGTIEAREAQMKSVEEWLKEKTNVLVPQLTEEEFPTSGLTAAEIESIEELIPLQ